jgi:hypothetical protein
MTTKRRTTIHFGITTKTTIEHAVAIDPSKIPDKTPVYYWDDNTPFARGIGFYDAANSRVFNARTGDRTGTTWVRYEVIPEGEIPLWMFDAQQNLQ